MSYVRRAAALAAVLALLAPAWEAGASRAVVRTPVCKLVTDIKGDATGTGTAVNSPQSDPDLDIIGADIATNAKTLTAVIRVAALDATDNTAPGGREYQFVFAVGSGTVTSVDAVIAPNGTSWYGGKGKGVVDTKKKEVRISVPLSALAVKVPANAVFKSLGARTYRVAGSDQIALGKADAADSAKTYKAGWPSCVKVGA